MNAQAMIRSEILDALTCDICYTYLNGIVLPADDPAWAGELGQEAHPRCRFMVVPIFEGIDPVLDFTPPEQIPEMVRHLSTLVPAAEQMRRAAQLRLLDGPELVQARELTLEDLQDIFTNEELIWRIFYAGGAE